jgi:hypothetical protein
MNKGRKLSIMMLSAIFVLAFAFTANAQGMGMGGGMGGTGMGVNGNTTPVADRFSGFGTVNAVDTAANTITVDVTMASRLLKPDIGTPVTFPVNTNVWIGSMGLGGMMSQSVTTGHGMRGTVAATKLSLSDIQTGDQVSFMGHFDSTGNQYIIDRLFPWLY